MRIVSGWSMTLDLQMPVITVSFMHRKKHRILNMTMIRKYIKFVTAYLNVNLSCGTIYESNGFKITLRGVPPWANLRKIEHKVVHDQTPCHQHPAWMGLACRTKDLSPASHNRIIA